MALDKIKRAITWIRTSLEITEKTTNPGTVAGTITPTIDTLGWERLGGEITARLTSATNTNIVFGAVVPNNVLRVILEASVDVNNGVLQFSEWIEHRDAESGVDVAVMRVITPPISALSIRCAMDRRYVVMRPGDRLQGRCSPNSGIGLNIVLRERFIDLPIGEYIRSL